MNSSSTIEVWPRIVNGIVVLAALGIACYAYRLLSGEDMKTEFGSFTTLIGTALAAYFGISATREASRNAINAISENSGQAQRLSTLKNIVQKGDPDHPVVKELQAALGS